MCRPQRIPMAPIDTVETAILACAENDSHTLALEAVRAALSERGHAAVMLGAAVPTRRSSTPSNVEPSRSRCCSGHKPSAPPTWLP